MRNLIGLLLCIGLLYSSAFGDQPIKAPADAPVYKLSNIRLEDDMFGRPEVICDYSRTKNGKGSYGVRFVARTEDGELIVMGNSFVMGQATGEVRLSPTRSGFGRRNKYNYEIYFVVNANWAGKSYGPCMVSNAVRIGNPGPATTARQWNAEEKEAFRKHQLGMKPPESDPPSGYKFADVDTKLLPGMKVMAGRYGEWTPGELLGINEDGDAQIRFGREKTVEMKSIDEWVTVSAEEIAKAKNDPESLIPSGRVLEGGKRLLPHNAVPVDDSMDLIPGTPLLIESFGKWAEVIMSKQIGTSIKYQRADSLRNRSMISRSRKQLWISCRSLVLAKSLPRI